MVGGWESNYLMIWGAFSLNFHTFQWHVIDFNDFFEFSVFSGRIRLEPIGKYGSDRIRLEELVSGRH